LIARFRRNPNITSTYLTRPHSFLENFMTLRDGGPPNIFFYFFFFPRMGNITNQLGFYDPLALGHPNLPKAIIQENVPRQKRIKGRLCQMAGCLLGKTKFFMKELAVFLMKKTCSMDLPFHEKKPAQPGVRSEYRFHLLEKRKKKTQKGLQISNKSIRKCVLI